MDDHISYNFAGGLDGGHTSKVKPSPSVTVNVTETFPMLNECIKMTIIL